MEKRWAIAAAATLAVGVLAAPILLTGGRRAAPDPGTPGTGAAPACKADRKVELDYTVKDMNGNTVDLGDFKGKAILLNYWATWCGPCKVEIPAFVELYSKYKDKGLVILGVSTDDDPETLRAFADEMEMNYPVLVGRDSPELLDALGPVWGLPTSFFIARDGSVCGQHMGPATKEDFEKAITPLL